MACAAAFIFAATPLATVTAAVTAFWPTETAAAYVTGITSGFGFMVAIGFTVVGTETTVAAILIMGSLTQSIAARPPERRGQRS